MPASSSTVATVYVFNSSSLINLERSKALKALRPLEEHGRLVIPRTVATEINKPGRPLETWLRRNAKCIVGFLPEEGRSYIAFIQQMDPKIHDGEAAALAVALHRGCTLVVDDGATKKKAAAHGVSCIDTATFPNRPLL